MVKRKTESRKTKIKIRPCPKRMHSDKKIIQWIHKEYQSVVGWLVNAESRLRRRNCKIEARIRSKERARNLVKC